MPYIPVVGDFVRPLTYSNSDFPAPPFPAYDTVGQPGIPYSSSSEWVNKRCQITGVVPVTGGTLVYLNLAQSGGGYATEWIGEKLIKTI